MQIKKSAPSGRFLETADAMAWRTPEPARYGADPERAAVSLTAHPTSVMVHGLLMLSFNGSLKAGDGSDQAAAVLREELKRVPSRSRAQATARSRSATKRRMRPWV